MHEAIEYLIPVLLVLVLSLGVWGCYWFLIGRQQEMNGEQKLPRQLMVLALGLVASLLVVIALPISEGSRNQLMAILGLLVSGVIAFSSTNILANLMGGILLRTTKPFRVGDFIRVEQHFGRVTERGLFDTEIQTENRDLISLPNAYLINHPITTTRSSGAIVSTNLSLGYDLHHGQVEPLLLQAAEECGLKEPFVHITELGNYAVSYRVSGLLEDPKRLITARSNLCRSILDRLHGQGLEIMSPGFMSQRPMAQGQKIIPKMIHVPVENTTEGGEHLAFDKAEEAERRENEKQRLLMQIDEIEQALKEVEGDKKDLLKASLENSKEQLKTLDLSASQVESNT